MTENIKTDILAAIAGGSVHIIGSEGLLMVRYTLGTDRKVKRYRCDPNTGDLVVWNPFSISPRQRVTLSRKMKSNGLTAGDIAQILNVPKATVERDISEGL